MTDLIHDAAGICKTIMRNGYDAYIVNAPVQKKLLLRDQDNVIDICTDLDFNGLARLFPTIEPSTDPDVTGRLEQGGAVFTFNPAIVEEGAGFETGVARFTPRMLKKFAEKGELPLHMACPYVPHAEEMNDGFADFEEGAIRLEGIPDETLKRNYLRALR
ncbi:MAG: HD family phosphohydrolase, partial [Desulfovibrionales bacterium]